MRNFELMNKVTDSNRSIEQQALELTVTWALDNLSAEYTNKEIDELWERHLKYKEWLGSEVE